MIYDVKNLCFAYSPSSKQVLNGVSFTLDEGEVLSILGPNGAGKSTLLNCLARLLTPQKGSITLCGKDISSLSFRDIAKQIGYVPQNHVPAFPYTVLNYVAMGRAHRIGLLSRPREDDLQSSLEALRTLGIEYLADKHYTEISGGERQQATIARVLVQDPKAILFDEPTAHLDYGNQLRILRLIREMTQRGYAVIITTHNPDHALLLGGQAAILDRSGQLEFGAAKDIITEEKLSKVYETELYLLDIEKLGRTACVPPKL